MSNAPGESDFRNLIERAPQGLAVLQDGAVAYVNPAGADLLRCERAKLIGRPISQVIDFVHADDRPAVEERYRRRLTGEQLVDPREIRVVRCDGVVRWFGYAVALLTFRGRDAWSIAFVDVTERRHAERALRHSLNLAAVLESTPATVAVVERSGEIIHVNRAWREFAAENGASDAVRGGVGLNYFEVCRNARGHSSEGARECLAGFEALVAGEREPFEHEYACHTPHKQMWFLLRAVPLNHTGDGLVISHVDVTKLKLAERELADHRERLEELVEQRTTELRASQQQLARSMRLASLGTLAAGVAHELDEPLAGMLMCLNEARALHAGEPAVRLLEAMRGDVERCAGVVRNVLRFARQREIEVQVVDVNELVRHTLELSGEYARRRDVMIELELGRDLPAVRGDRAEIGQALLNVLQNAIDACEDGGHVWVATSAAAGAVRIAVRDTGRGMTPGELDRALEPFFTTRAEQGRMGLGLSTSHGIIAALGGTLRLESKPGWGSEVELALPALAEE